MATVLIKLCKRRNFWQGNASSVIRSYFFKLATYHLFFCGMCFVIYYSVYKRAGYEETMCFYFWHYRWMLITVLPVTVFVYALRYMAFGLASSNKFQNKGIEMPNPRVRHDVKQDWSADTPSYKKILGNFYTLCMIIIGLSLITLFFVVSEEYRNSLKKTSICTPALQDSYVDHFVFFIMIILCANFSAVFAEFLLRERQVDDFFGVVLNTPFTTTTAATSWLSWFALVFYMYFYVDAFAGQYIMLLGYLVIVDASWYVILCCLASVTRF